ncbi:C40 family peptidase [Sphingosinithalassobacter sp. LHW66-3]|uniref:C40 family peptidase n=1 Tax=Sphingosinithalassobacter sp. LHW66-3 TaxID=3424718 RepID=UPI003D6A27EC
MAIAQSAVVPAPILADRIGDADPISEILPGERFEILELAHDQGWGICTADGAVGYVPDAAFGDLVEPTHIVQLIAAPVSSDPHPDSPKLWTLPMGARVVADAAEHGFHALAEGGFVADSALRGVDEPFTDPVEVAEMLVGVPVRPGGRSGAGVDAGGLIHLALAMAGISAPRFCDLQAQALGAPLEDERACTRGDLVFFAGHAAILADAETAIHADTAEVVREPLAALIERGDHGPVTAVRRLK